MIGLVAIGAYERTPLREGLIEGVTHDIALRASILVLMSHYKPLRRQIVCLG